MAKRARCRLAERNPRFRHGQARNRFARSYALSALGRALAWLETVCTHEYSGAPTRSSVKETQMDKTEINPWTWQDQWGFSQAWKVEGGTVVFLAGQTGVDDDGEFVHHDDFEGEVRLMFDNMRRVMEEAGGSLQDVVRLTVFIKDMDKIWDFTRIKKDVFGDYQPAQSAIGVSTLAVPELTLEVEATAVL
jgi:enamine deaminase RidA (YjgF/YER057c/UK114 family)